MLRAGPAGRLGLLGQAHDGDGVCQGGCQRSADVEALARLQHRGRLLQMFTAIEAHDHHDVAATEQLVHRPDQLDVVLDHLGFPLR